VLRLSLFRLSAFFSRGDFTLLTLEPRRLVSAQNCLSESVHKNLSPGPD